MAKDKVKALIEDKKVYYSKSQMHWKFLCFRIFEMWNFHVLLGWVLLSSPSSLGKEVLCAEIIFSLCLFDLIQFGEYAYMDVQR